MTRPAAWKPYYSDDHVTLFHGDCLDVMRTLPDASVDSVVTDPPYGLEFMGKGWDAPWEERDVNADAGFHGGGVSATRNAPSFTGSTNPKCLTCKGTRRGRRDGTAKVAVCLCPDGGRFPNVRAVEMRAFGAWCELWAAECLRVLKPGGHLLAFGGSRTWHRLAVAIEDAGFELRDSIAWLYGSGFPKSLNVATAIERHRTALMPEEEAFCQWMRDHSGLTAADARRLFGSDRFITGEVQIVNTATVDNPRMGRRAMVPTYAAWQKARPALVVDPPEWVESLVKSPPLPPGAGALGWKQGKGQGTVGDNEWAGWGTALKPAFEPVVVARKPLVGTVASNVLAWGTGALNIDATRISTDEDRRRNARGGDNGLNGEGTFRIRERRADDQPLTAGRWPANVVLDEHAAAELDRQSGVSSSNVRPPTGRDTRGIPNTSSQMVMRVNDTTERGHNDTGGASRFFPTFRYEAKAPTSERPRVGGIAHPTVKPLDLMRWLVRLVTPPGGTVLEPFAGSGTTAEACVLEGFQCVAIEREADYLPLIVSRIDKPVQLGLNFEEPAS